MHRRIKSVFPLLFLCAFAPLLTAQSVITDIAVPGSPSGIAVNPGNNRIYVGLSTSTGYAVTVIDGKTNSIVDTVQLKTGALVAAANVGTGRVYIAGCTYSQSPVTCGVSVLDGNTDKVIATISINASAGIGLEGITVNPVTNRIYIADATNLVVEEIDGTSNRIIANISLGGQQPLGLAVDFGTNQLMVAINGDQMASINAFNNSIHRVTVGTTNANVAVNSFTGRGYITNEVFAPSTVGVVNLTDGQVVANIPVGNTSFGVAVDIFSNLVFITNLGDQTVAVVDGKTNAKIASVSAASNFIDVNPVTQLVYASDTSAGLVHVISE